MLIEQIKVKLMVGVSLSQFLFNLSLFVTNTAEICEAAPAAKQKLKLIREDTKYSLRLDGRSKIM